MSDEHPLKPMLKAFGEFTAAINKATDSIGVFARAIKGEPMPRVGDFVRVTGDLFNFGYQKVPIGSVGVICAVNPEQAYGGIHVRFPDGSVAHVHLYGRDENAERIDDLVTAIGGLEETE